MKKLTSIIMTACQQGDWVRRTVPLVRQSMGSEPHEIIVVDDQCTDGSCHDLPRDVLVLRTDQRKGVSASRRFAVDNSEGDVLLFTDPHCEYTDDSLGALANAARHKCAIVQPTSRSAPRGRIRFGGQFATCDRGLRVKRAYGRPAPYPVLYGTVYAVRRRLYDDVGGWPELPGCWGYSEQALSLAAWFAGVPILVETTARCLHWHYHGLTKFEAGISSDDLHRLIGENQSSSFSYACGRSDQAKNAHFVHGLFFPQTYERIWRPMLDSRFGNKDDYRKENESRSFRRQRSKIEHRRVRTEQQFFSEVLGLNIDGSQADPKYIRQQQKCSKPRTYRGVQPRVQNAINWFIRNIPGCIRDRTVLDCGTRDGFAVEYVKEQGGALDAMGIELIEETALYASGNLGRHVVQGDMMNLMQSDDSWNVVMSIHSLEHVPDARRAIDEMVRVCAPTGWVLIVVPQEQNKPKGSHNVYFPSPESLVEMVVANQDVDPNSVKVKRSPLSNKRTNIVYCYSCAVDLGYTRAQREIQHEYEEGKCTRCERNTMVRTFKGDIEIRLAVRKKIPV